MAQLTKAMHDARDAVAPRAKVVAPPLVTRLQYQLDAIRSYETQRVGGKPVWRYYDAVALSLYPLATYHGRTGVPEDSIRQLRAAQKQLRRSGVPASKPIWDTEVNYGLQGGEVATPASTEQQQANVALTYLINAAGGIGRVYWYAWDLHAIADTDLVGADNATPSAAGSAFATVRRWLLGSKVESCQRTGGFWQCALQTPTGTARVYWVPGGGQASVTTAFDATSAETLGQPAAAIPLGGTTLEVGALPVLVSSDASGSSAVPPRI
jgi:polysaccharide biosynthesis protein PslG